MRFVVIVQTVRTDQFDNRLFLHLWLWYIRDVHARGIALVFHVETELVLLHGRGEIIHVAHHQFPVRHLRRLTRVLQRFHEKGIRRIVGNIRGEFSHLISLAVIGVFVCHCQHLICLQGCSQRDVAHGTVQGVFRGIQQSRTLQFLVGISAFQSLMTVEHRSRLVNITRLHVARIQLRIQAVRMIGGRNVRRGSLTEIIEGHDVTGVCRRSCLVRHPHFHAVDGDARCQVGQLLHRSVILVTEESGEEEVAVLFIVRNVQFERCGLHATLTGDALRCRFLLRHHRLQLQFAKLQIRADTKQTRCTAHQGGIAGEGHVSAFHEFHDLVFLTLIFQLHVLGVIVERRIRIVVQVQVHFVTHLSVHAQINLLVEVHRRGLTVTDRQRRIIDVLHRGTQFQLCRSLRPHTHAARTEDLLCGSQFEMHVREVKLLLTFRFIDLVVLLAVEVLTQLPVAPFAKLLGGHQHGSAQILSAHLRTEEIAAQSVVIFRFQLNVLRHRQIRGTPFQILLSNRLCPLYFPPWIQQRVGNHIILIEDRLCRNVLFVSPLLRSIIIVSSRTVILSLRVLSISRSIILKPRRSGPGEHIHAHQCHHH